MSDLIKEKLRIATLRIEIEFESMKLKNEWAKNRGDKQYYSDYDFTKLNHKLNREINSITNYVNT